LQSFTFYLPTKIVFGPGRLETVGTEAKTLGQQALIITGKRSSSEYGIVHRVTDYLEKEGIGAIVFDKIEPNPRTATIDAAAALARENGCDFVIGLGGGSPMDAAKGVAVAAATGKPVWDFVSHGQPVPKPIGKALPIIEIPTLAATGSEANAGAVITNWDTHEKAVLAHPLLFPKVSIIDPELTITVPRDYTVDGGIDIICHVIEGFFTGADKTPIQDRFSLSIVRTVIEYLPRVLKDPGDIDARSQLSWCSSIALSGLINLGRGGAFPLHAMEHALSGHYDISHGRGLALLLPHLMEYSYQSRPEKYALMAREIFDTRGGDDAELGRAAISGMVKFLDSVDRYLKMADVGIADDTKFEQMAEDTIRIYSGGKDYLDNPMPLYKDDIVRIFKMAGQPRKLTG